MEEILNVNQEEIEKLSVEELTDVKMELEDLIAKIDKLISECDEAIKE